MKKILLCLAFVLSASVVNAQVTATAIWNQPNPLTNAQTYTYTLKIDTAAPINLTATCTLINSVTQCQAPVTNWNNTINHTLVLTASDGTNSASGTFTSSPGPGSPTGSKIIIVIVGN